MNRLRQILKDRRGVAFPLIIAIVLVLVMLMCCISEYFRLPRGFGMRCRRL